MYPRERKKMGCIVYIEIGERRNGQNDIANAAVILFLCTISRMRIRYHWTYYTANLKGQSIQLTLVSCNLGPCLSAAGKNEIWVLVQNNKPKHLTKILIKNRLYCYKRPRRASLLPIIYFMGNHILLSCFIVRMTAKTSFCLSSIPEAMDQAETLLSLLFRHLSIYQGTICQCGESR